MSFNLQNVLISDEVDDKCVDILRSNGIEVVKNTKLSKEQLISEISKYDGLIVRSATKVTADVIAAATNLKIIGRAGTGVDNIDCDAATKKGIIVMNTPGGNTLSAAEHTCALLMAMSRNIAQGTESIHQGRWDRKKLMGNEVNGKTLAILGLGRIGKEVATRMQAFGMTTIGFDPITPSEVAASFGVKSMSLDEIWPQADYITVHTPLIPQTKNLLNDTTLNKCKKGVKVINCARGGIIDEDALLRALESGQCGAAALDVFVQEPPTESPIIKHPKVTCTPHLGASTLEAQSRVAEDIAKQFVDMVKGKELFGAINAAALANALSPNTRPWVRLGTALGQLGSALLRQISNDTQVKLVTYGSGLENAASYLGAAVLVGVLRPKSQNGLNLVSAPAVAKEMGLKVSTEHKEAAPDGFSELVTVTVQQPGGATYTLSGLVGAGVPLLVTLNKANFSPRVALEGTNLVYSSASTSVLGAVVGAVTAAGSTVRSFSSSASLDNQTWSLMQVAPPLSNLDTIKSSVKFIQQVAF